MTNESGSSASGTDFGGGFLAGAGEMGALLRAINWRDTPLGPLGGWPQSLRTTMSICLNSRFPIAVYWGPEFLMLYNESLVPMVGARKHPHAIGQPARIVLAEIWTIIEPLLQHVRTTGEATWSEDLMLPLARTGGPEESYFTFTYSPVRDETGGVGGVFCAVVETTDKVIEERRLRLLNALAQGGRTRTAADACAHAAAELSHSAKDVPFALLYLVDAAGVATLAGAASLPAGRALAPATIRIGDPPWFLDPTADEFRMVSLLDGPEGARGAIVMPLAPSDGGAPLGFIICGLSDLLAQSASYTRFHTLLAASISQNVTNAIAAEEERKRLESLAQLDRAKTAFFSNISHEFRTPLTLLLGPAADALADDEPLSPRARERWSLVHRNALRLSKLVNTLLEFSRIEAGRVEASFEPTALDALTCELASMFESAVQRGGLSFHRHFPALDEPAYVDLEMWEKVVFNLLSNALKYTFDGVISVSLERRGEFFELVVRDTGTGIASADLPHVFDRFHRIRGAQARSHEGTGIGLALVTELVKLHSGQIAVDSVEGEGTGFTVRIPRGRAHLPAEQIRPSRGVSVPTVAAPYLEEVRQWEVSRDTERMDTPAVAAAKLAGRTILVADDNADMREYISRLFDEQWCVVTVADGAAALAAAREHQPDLVITDVMMPGLDGFALLAAIRAEPTTSDTSVILLSARAGEEATLAALAAGADDYVVKPFTARDLRARVDAQLHRAAARQAIRESEKRFRVMADAVPQIVWIVDATGAVEFLNQQWTAYTGAPYEPATMREWVGAFLHPEDGPSTLDAFEEVRQSGRTLVVEHRIRSRAGDYRWFLVKADPYREAPSGPILRWFGVSVDIHDRRIAEAALAAAAARDEFRVRLADALRPIADPTMVQATACRVLGERLAANRVAYFEVRGHDYFVDSDYVNGAPPLADTYAMDTFGPTLLALYRRGDTASSCDVAADANLTVAERAGYAAIQIGAYIGVPLVKQGHLVAGLTAHSANPRRWTAEDIALVEETAERTWAAVERARAEAAVRQNQLELQDADRRKDEFLAMLAHELRNPLAPIRTGLELIRIGGNSPRAVERVRPMMERQVAHMVRLIDDLLDVSRISTGKIQLQRQPTALSTLVTSAVDANRTGITAKQIELGVDLPETPCLLDVDPTRFVQIVSNLLHNATKFTPQGGAIRLSARISESSDSEARRLSLRVADTGVGIPLELLPRVFDLFTQGERQSAEPGLGIGLALARQLVEMHGGEITARSSGPGQGSVFEIQLPLPAMSDAPAIDEDRVGTVPLNRRVVVIDDNHDAADATAMLVESLGGSTRVAYDGENGLREVLDYRPDVVLLDIGMQPVDGYETCRRIREAVGDQVVIVALTGWGQDQDKGRARDVGFDAHLTKPADPAMLARIIGGSS